MDWKKQRVLFVGALFAVLLGVTLWLQRRGDEDTAAPQDDKATALPEIERDDITALVIQRPGEAPIELKKSGKAWRVVAPVQAATDADNVNAALDKLAELEVSGVVARNTKNFAKLELSEDKAVRVVVRKGNKDLITLRLGAYRGGNTMARIGDAELAVGLSGSLKWIFDKALSEWRDRKILELEAGQVASVRITSDKGEFTFEKKDDSWVKTGPVLKDFEPSKVDDWLASIVTLQASDFGGPSLTAEDTAFDKPRATLELSYHDKSFEAAGKSKGAGTDAAAQGQHQADAASKTVRLRLGQTVSGRTDSYVQREGRDIVYIIGSFLADKLMPEASAFQKDEEKDDSGAPAAPAAALGAPGAAGGTPQLPPELMQQLRQQAGQ
ncbi:MAG: DUF4340 domain-containing protein [Polyangiales bacterium]